jgi:hypothetical protein
MPLTQFPKGVSSFGVPVIGSGLAIPPTMGNYFFVSSVVGSDSNYGTDPGAPLATVAKAISYTKAANGDCIVMFPYHTESIASAGAWTPVAGSSIVGLGWGGSRPKISFTATGSTIAVSAANVLLQNFVTTTGVSEVVSCIAVTAADCTINAVDHIETGTYTCIGWVLTTAAANRLTINGCNHKTTTAPAGTVAWICIVGGDSITISNNNIIVARPAGATAACIGCITTLTSNAMIYNNNLVCLGSTSNLTMTFYASSTGIAAYNNCVGAKTSCRGMIALAGIYGIQNYANMTVNTNGILDPVATTT